MTGSCSETQRTLRPSTLRLSPSGFITALSHTANSPESVNLHFYCTISSKAMARRKHCAWRHTRPVKPELHQARAHPAVERTSWADLSMRVPSTHDKTHTSARSPLSRQLR